MKAWKIGICCGFLLFLGMPLLFFLETRVWVDKYHMDGGTVTFKSEVFVQKDSLSQEDTQNLGKTIGIAVLGKRTITDYIWPIWVMEYRDDPEHNRIFVRSLMDLGSVYMKQPHD